MKTLTKSPAKVSTIKTSTWLPLFNGYYGSFYESFVDGDVDSEIEYRNEDRNKKLPPITWENLDIAYSDIYKQISLWIFEEVSDKLKELSLISGSTYERLSSPREYNFYNDSIHAQFTFSPKNIRIIKSYIKAHFVAWDKYLHDHYTSYDGFISSHDNYATSEDWGNLNEVLLHDHRSAQVLAFILINEGFNEDEIVNQVTEQISSNGLVCQHIEIVEPEISEELKAEIEADNYFTSNDPAQLSLDI